MTGIKAREVLERLEHLHYTLNAVEKDKHGQNYLEFGMFEHGAEGESSLRVASGDAPEAPPLTEEAE